MESKKLFFYELEGRGYIFQNKKWDEAKHGFEDDMLNMAWEMWSSAKHSVKAQAVPEGFVLAPVEEVKTWYLDDDESIYREDPDWLCNTPVGEVVEVERRISYELDQAPLFAAITWDEDNQDVGYYETFATKDEAKKAATHCKAMIEAQEQKG